MSSIRSVSSLPLPPGPRGLPFFGSLPTIRRDPHLALDRLVRRYGDVCLIRLGSVPVAIVSDPAVLAEAFARAELTDRWQTAALTALTGGRSLAMAPYGEHWRQLDSFIRDELLGAGNLNMARENHTEPEVARLVGRMGEMAEAGEPVHPNAMLDQSTFDLAFRTFFGEVEDDTAGSRETMDLLRRDFDWTRSNADRPDPADVLPWVGFVPGKAVRDGRRLKDVRERILGALVDSVRRRPDPDPTSPACLMDFMLGREEAGGITRPMILDLLVDMMMPHTDGVAATVKWFLLIVANRPEVQARVHEELDQVVGRDALPALEDRTRLPYTFAAIAECMRYRTASPLGIPHSASQDTEIGGYRIPAGTKVLGNLYGIHHDPRFWDSPHEVVPERFLPRADGSPAEALTGGAFIPFGTGRRRCTGEQLGEIDVWLYITRLLHRFRFEIPGETLLSEDEVPGLTVTPRPYALKATCRR